jgi:glutamate 5-kinase
MRIVIKVGTSTLIAKEISALRTDGHEILIVSSGAVDAGKAHLRIKNNQKTLR